MDAIPEVPVGVVIEGLAFDAVTKKEVPGMKSTGHSTALTPVHELMLAREAGDWDVVARPATTLGLSLPFVDQSHSESVTWAHQMTSGAPRQ